MLSDIQGAVFSSLHNIYSKGYLQFKDENHFVLVFKGVVEVDELAVVEVVHDVNLLADQSLLHGVPDRDELGGVHMLSLQLSAAVDLQRCDYKTDFCFFGLSLNSCGKIKYFHICPLMIYQCYQIIEW